MKDIRELQVVQVRLFAAGAIQPVQIAAPTVRAALEETFKFQASGLNSLATGVSFTGSVPVVALQEGEFLDKEGQRVVIASLEIGARRILTRIAGDSAQADAFFNQFSGVVEELVPSMQGSLLDVIYRAEETSCVVALDIDFAKVFRPKVASFINKHLAAATSEAGIKASTKVVRFATRIEYDVSDRRIKEHGITLNPKEFVVEPRAATPHSSHVYLTKSPLPSDEHLRLVEEFEATVP